MCYDDEARPPLPPGEAGATRGEDLVLTADDGNRFLAYAAHPARPGAAQVIIYPDVRGLHHFYKELALRFAEAGIAAIAIDYFGRTAGLTGRDETFDSLPHTEQMNMESLAADVRAAQSYLRKQNQVGAATFTVGFCLGGTCSYRTGMDKSFGFAGVIGFYASLSPDFGDDRAVLERAEEVTSPSLGLFGGADPSIPVSMVEEFDQRLEKTGMEHTIIVYPGAPHCFFDRYAAEFAEASADAWTQVLSFIHAHTHQESGSKMSAGL
jgi:carboxymethylenebutenolidase